MNARLPLMTLLCAAALPLPRPGGAAARGASRAPGCAGGAAGRARHADYVDGHPSGAPAIVSSTGTIPASDPDALLESSGTTAPRSSHPVIPTPASDLQIQPSWETQKLARTYVFTIPAPRGQITDRNGIPLAQNRVSSNLAIVFPSPPQFTDEQARRYIAEQTAAARGILRRDLGVDVNRGLKHYQNRGIMPLVIASDLLPAEAEAVKRANPGGLTLLSGYQRIYPQGATAGHIVGYVGRQGTYSVNPVENNEALWPGSEGRSGIERGFNDQLTGRPGVMHVSFDAQGRKSSEKVTVPPTPGQNVVLAIDLKLQRLCEDSIKTTKRPGAIVFMDPNNGEILALASGPSFDPNDFIPQISESDFAKLKDDPMNPLLARAYGSAYPLGSVFKIITGLAAMNEGKVDPEDEFGGEASIEIGGTTFRNWKKTDAGPLNFVQALTQSCNTYFYKMGLKCGYQPIIDYCQRLGLGSPVGLPIVGETAGLLPTPDYMIKVEKRRPMPGDIANLSIGQGALQVSPIQVCSAMCSVGNGGTVFQPRLVMQIQGVDDKITFGYEMRVRDQIEIEKNVMKALRNGMVSVVEGSGGTAHVASMPGIHIAAKTGTAQWGAGKNERVAAWFAGYAPATKPRYAFASLYEGKLGDDSIHGGTHSAPMIARVLKEILKPEPKETSKKGGLRKKKAAAEDEDEANDDMPIRPKVLSTPKDEDEEQ